MNKYLISDSPRNILIEIGKDLLFAKIVDTLYGKLILV